MCPLWKVSVKQPSSRDLRKELISQQNRLDGTRVAIIVTDDFEQVEMTSPRQALEQAGATTVLISPQFGQVKSKGRAGRELLMQVLAYLAPDSVFSKEDCAKYGVNKPTRKMRIKHILGYSHNSAVELIECMANTIDKMYDVLVGEAHRRDDKSYDDDTIMGQLATLGGLIIMLLRMHSNI